MAVFAYITEAGALVAFYDTEIGMPPPFEDLGAALVEVSPETRDAWIADPWQKLVGGALVPSPPPPLTTEQQLALLPPVSRVQMLAALVDFEIITEAEAVGWLGGDLPAVVQAAIDGLPEGARLVATLRAKAQTPVDPSDPLVAALAASKDMGPEALVLLFQHAAAL